MGFSHLQASCCLDWRTGMGDHSVQATNMPVDDAKVLFEQGNIRLCQGDVPLLSAWYPAHSHSACLPASLNWYVRVHAVDQWASRAAQSARNAFALQITFIFATGIAHTPREQVHQHLHTAAYA